MAESKGAVAPLDDGATLDDIEDLPGFAVFPSGAYRILLQNGLEKKDIGDHKAVEMAMTLQETLELTEAVEVNDQPKVGDVCSIAFMLDNKFGQGALKEVLTPIAEKLGTRNVGEIYAGSNGLQLMIVLKRTYDKDKDRHYGNIKKCVVL